MISAKETAAAKAEMLGAPQAEASPRMATNPVSTAGTEILDHRRKSLGYIFAKEYLISNAILATGALGAAMYATAVANRFGSDDWMAYFAFALQVAVLLNLGYLYLKGLWYCWGVVSGKNEPPTEAQLEGVFELAEKLNKQSR